MLAWISSLFLLTIGLAATVANAFVIIRYLSRGKGASTLPLVGGVAGALGLLILPVSGARAWSWVPLVFDYGSIPLILSYILSRFKA